MELYYSGNTQVFAVAIGMLPVVWITLNILRFLLFAFFNYVIGVLQPGRQLPFGEVVFGSAAGLRGSVSLIMGQAIVHETKYFDLDVVRACDWL